MKNCIQDEMEHRLITFIIEASPEDLDRILFIIKYIKIATPEQMDELKQQLKREDFKGPETRAWIDSKRPLVMEVK